MMKKYALIAAMALLLSACGGGGSKSAGNSGGSTGGNTSTDTFTNYVASLAGTPQDTSEPPDVDTVALTTSETEEPSAVN